MASCETLQEQVNILSFEQVVSKSSEILNADAQQVSCLDNGWFFKRQYRKILLLPMTTERILGTGAKLLCLRATSDKIMPVVTESHLLKKRSPMSVLQARIAE